MIPSIFLFQLCIVVFYNGEDYYNCSVEVIIVDSQQEVQKRWDVLYAELNDGKQWDGWPIQSFWSWSERIIVLHDPRDFTHEYMHAYCEFHYYYSDRTNHPWCEDKPHWKIQK